MNYYASSVRQEVRDYQPVVEVATPFMQQMSIQTPIRSLKASTDLRVGPTTSELGKMIYLLIVSNENIRIVQNAIRRRVFELSNEEYTIPDPDAIQLKMALHEVVDLHADFYPADGITSEIARLNSMTVEAASAQLVKILKNNKHFQSVQGKQCKLMINPVSVDRDFKEVDCRHNMGRGILNGACRPIPLPGASPGPGYRR